MLKTKTELVRQHLNNHGSISSLEAFDLFNLTRLSAVIFNLRKRGMNIESVPMNAKNGVRFVRYYVKDK